ncbi:arsenic resistance protein [Pontibacter virosus]|uniref:ACR3 family arsenite efflux pump ArsB n=1 Tax=Pontibacter virosus TaxID=1765052 RepID=A0A2U1AR79_9BACT|nr:arsenic resistance protein [Pontibacter virosus]PVY38943.1 ACR3 family arsenite efflux pump ArsB [Pontibacter virosus]
MSLLNKFHTLIILVAVLLGLLLTQIPLVEAHAASFIIPFLMLMLYGLFLAMPLRGLKQGFLHKRFVTISLLINFVWTPLLAYLLGYLFLSDQQALWIGFVMLMVTPCTDWYIIFTGISKGNTVLAAAILPLNLLLQVVLLPVYLLLFFNQTGMLPIEALLEGILLVIAVPFGLAQATRFFMLSSRRQTMFQDRLLPFFESMQIVFLGLAITAMFASEGKLLLGNLEVLYVMLIPLLIFFIINFVLSRLAGRWAGFSYADSVSLSLTTLARNSPVSLAIAVAAFPDTPLIALALIVGPLVELPVLGLFSQALLLFRRKLVSK